MDAASAAASVRTDVWLWAARLFRTRSLCHEAIVGGKIQVNGAHCKPARPLRIGDRLLVTRGEERLEIDVLAVSNRRGDATAAQTLYRETPASVAARLAAAQARRLGSHVAPAGRPDKAARRLLRALKQQD